MESTNCYREIGGYIEFEKFNGSMLYEDAIKLNCGRNALAYLVEARSIRQIALPKFMCDSCDRIIKSYGLTVRYYSIGLDFKPTSFKPEPDEWLYLVNFYGQITNDYLANVWAKHKRLIVDNAQAYFQVPIKGVDTIYTCRKFFGVADGAILYTDIAFNRKLEQDESFERMHFLLGRYERTASEFYPEYMENNHLFDAAPIKRMSKLTENLLRGIDYNKVCRVRTNNFTYLHEKFGSINKLSLEVPEGAFMYPLYIKNGNGSEVRKVLQKMRVYIPILWPAVFNRCLGSELEYQMAMNILPLPCDQRYGIEDMEYIYRMFNDLRQNEN